MGSPYRPKGGQPTWLRPDISLNNDLIADVAERIVAGERPAYDNRGVVGEAELSSYASQVGGVDGLAGSVEHSARRLAKAWSALDAETGGYMVPVVIVHSGKVVKDEPVAIKELIEGNASFHLSMHLAQLMALRG